MVRSRTFLLLLWQLPNGRQPNWQRVLNPGSVSTLHPEKHEESCLADPRPFQRHEVALPFQEHHRHSSKAANWGSLPNPLRAARPAPHVQNDVAGLSGGSSSNRAKYPLSSHFPEGQVLSSADPIAETDRSCSSLQKSPGIALRAVPVPPSAATDEIWSDIVE